MVPVQCMMPPNAPAASWKTCQLEVVRSHLKSLPVPSSASDSIEVPAPRVQAGTRPVRVLSVWTRIASVVNQDVRVQVVSGYARVAAHGCAAGSRKLYSTPARKNCDVFCHAWPPSSAAAAANGLFHIGQSRRWRTNACAQ